MKILIFLTAWFIWVALVWVARMYIYNKQSLPQTEEERFFIVAFGRGFGIPVSIGALTVVGSC